MLVFSQVCGSPPGKVRASPAVRRCRRSEKTRAPNRVITVMSTRSDSRHGHEDNDSEVPRRTLVTELKRHSTHRSTQELEPDGSLVLTLDFDLRA